MKPKEAAAKFGVSKPTLAKWAEEGRIKAIRTGSSSLSHHRYDLQSYVETIPDPMGEQREPGPTASKSEVAKDAPASRVDRGRSRKQVFCYARASTLKQRADLTRQGERLQSVHPDSVLVTDIGSGLNYKRRGLRRLIQAVIAGEVSEVVVAHRDRLCRFGFDLISWLFELYGVKIIVLDSEVGSDDAELCKDVLDVVHVFSCRRNGRRRYARSAPRAEASSKDSSSEESPSSGREMLVLEAS